MPPAPPHHKADIIYMSHNRSEFTRVSLPDLIKNTNPAFVNQVHVIDDSSTKGSRDWLKEFLNQDHPVPVQLHLVSFGSVVMTMNYGIERCTEPFVAKIDNDLIVPPEWLEKCISVLTRHPELVLLGIDNKNEVAEIPHNKYIYSKVRHIGGIGVFRRAFFANLPTPNPDPNKRQFHGFTEFQWSRPNAIKGWINPGIPTILLDRVPLKRFQDLIPIYQKKGWQRGCGPYSRRENFWKWRFPGEKRFDE